MGDAATFINGYPFKPSEWTIRGLPIIRIQNLTGSSNVVNYYDKLIDERYEVNDGDILISWSASLGVYEWRKGKALLNQHIFKVVFDKLAFDKSFFKYIISQKIEEMLQFTHGSTMKHITKKYFDEILIPLPPLDVQQKIADILNRAYIIIEKRKAQIAKLDLLVKSQFIEMFGDPVTNSKNWPVKQIKEFAMVKIGPFGSLLHAEDYIEGGIPLVNPSHISDRKIVIDPKLTISNEKYKGLSAYAMQAGDVVLGRRGEIGRCAVVTAGEHLCGTGSMFIRIEHGYLPMMLQWIISSDSMRKLLENKAVGITMLNLNAGMISGLEVITPPLDLQNRFANLVRAADKSKLEMRQGLNKLELLYKSLMQKCFNGEIF